MARWSQPPGSTLACIPAAPSKPRDHAAELVALPPDVIIARSTINAYKSRCEPARSDDADRLRSGSPIPSATGLRAESGTSGRQYHRVLSCSRARSPRKWLDLLKEIAPNLNAGRACVQPQYYRLPSQSSSFKLDPGDRAFVRHRVLRIARSRRSGHRGRPSKLFARPPKADCCPAPTFTRLTRQCYLIESGGALSPSRDVSAHPEFVTDGGLISTALDAIEHVSTSRPPMSIASSRGAKPAELPDSRADQVCAGDQSRRRPRRSTSTSRTLQPLPTR